MKVAFPRDLLDRVRELDRTVADFRALDSEIRLAREHLPALAGSEKRQREDLSRFSPSAIIELRPAVRAAFDSLRITQMQLDALRASGNACEARLHSLEAALKRGSGDVARELASLIHRACPKPAPGQSMVNTAFGLVTPACAETLNRLAAINASSALERAAALVAFCAELGATLEAAAETERLKLGTLAAERGTEP